MSNTPIGICGYPDEEVKEDLPSDVLQLIANLWSDECTDEEIDRAKRIYKQVNGREW